MKGCTNINKTKKSAVVRTLKNNNNTEVSDDINKANFINSYLTSIGENLSQKHSIPDDFDILNHIYRISPTNLITAKNEDFLTLYPYIFFHNLIFAQQSNHRNSNARSEFSRIYLFVEF